MYYFQIDNDAINAQIEERKKLKEAEKKRDDAYVAECVRQSEVIKQKESEIEMERRKRMNDLNEYRRNFQKREDTREFDLNGPNTSLPARIGDNDPRLTISSAQIFLGEDLMCAERKKIQCEQQKAWLRQQIAERKQAERDREESDRLFLEAQAVRDQRALELDEAEKNIKKKMLESTIKFNEKLALEHEKRKMEKLKNEQEDNLAEMYNCITSEMLTESHSLSKSNFGPNHKLVTAYKGMTEEEIQALRVEQLKQAEEDRKIKAKKAEEEHRWNMLANNIDRTLVLQDRRTQRQKQEIQNNLNEENKQLAEKQKQNLKHINNIIYTNVPTPDYYAQFNTTSR